MMETEKTIEAGRIASEVAKYAKDIIKPGMPLLEIAEKIEAKIKELGGEPAFPVNLSINEIAAHYTPSNDDIITAAGLLKVDLGVHVDGWIADTAFSLDMEGNIENKALIETAEKCLSNALKIAKKDVLVGEIGKEIYRTAISSNMMPIINLSGHEIDRYDLHAGITIPNKDEKKATKLGNGIYAIEPFVTFGDGRVHDGKPSEIYLLLNSKNVRSPIAREILTHVIDEYGSLPFCSRWLVKEFGEKAKVGLRELTAQGNLHRYAELVEDSKRKVAQAEHTILIDKNKVTITTE